MHTNLDIFETNINFSTQPPYFPGGGGVLHYVPPQRVGVLHHFGLKTGIHFAYLGLESGMVFEGTTGCMNLFIVSIPNE